MVANAEKKYESGKLETGSEAFNELWRELMAGRAAAAALKAAVTKFDVAEKARLKSKEVKSGPALGRKPREADHFKCRKVGPARYCPCHNTGCRVTQETRAQNECR